VRVYKFLTAEIGLKCLWEKRLKITTVSEFNDPFDLLPFKIDDRESRKRVNQINKNWGLSNGMLCFSSDWRDPVIWAHYSDSHRGLCLGFDIKYGKQVDYVDHRQPLTNEPYANVDVQVWLNTKYSSWQYEGEIRQWLTLSEPVKINKKKYYFKPFGEDLKLGQVIAGAKSVVSKKEILDAISPLQGVELIQARGGVKKFEIVPNQRGFREDRT